MTECPAGFKACYPTFQCQDCLFWRNGKCDYETMVVIEESIGQLATVSEANKSQLSGILPPPSFIDNNGVRYFDQEWLRRAQDIAERKREQNLK